MKFLRKYADNTSKTSIVNKWRRKRFVHFEELVKDLPRPIKILDIGGTENFWVQMNFTKAETAEIILFNIEEIKTSFSNISYAKGDARDLSRFNDNEFDVVFSNSVIEHVGNYENQRKMADEVMRVGKKFFVQTPNYYFPVEPHFLFPFFQFLPMKIKIFLVMNFHLGWFEKLRTKEEAVSLINSIRLLKQKEAAELFHGSKIINERLLGLTKSFMIKTKN